MNNEQIWQAVLGEIELNLSKAYFTTWFNNTFISYLDDEKIIIGVPNTFTKTWLEKKYHEEIANALENVTIKELKKSFIKLSPKKSAA